MSKRLVGGIIIGCKYKTSSCHLNGFPDGSNILGQQYNTEEKPTVMLHTYYINRYHHGLGGANPAVNTPRPSRGTRIESCDFIVLIGDP